MGTINNKIQYMKINKTILFDDKIIVDLSKAPEKAVGKVYSKATEDSSGTDIYLVIEGSNLPFNIQLASFSPSGFIRAIVENRLEVEGMVAFDEIQHAYEYILGSITC